MQHGPEYSSSSVHAEGVLLPLYDPRPPFTSATDAARWHYCQAHGAMGGLCDESAPDPLPWPTAPAVNQQWALERVVVVVTAGNRLQYLCHTLSTLLATPGAQPHNLHVIFGDALPSTTQLLRLLGLSFTILPVQGRGNAKLFLYYRRVFELVAHSFANSSAVIFLDEDVEVSPDFFSFMSQTIWLLHADPTLYCINAFSFLPDMSRGRGAQYVRRGSVQASWGYAVTLSFVREALQVWPLTVAGQDILTYDYWLYVKVRGQRECVYPEVSRLRHYGMGINTYPYVHEYSAWHRPLLHSQPVTLLNAALMLHAAHESDFVKGLREATMVEAMAPCDLQFPTRASKATQSLLVLFNQIEAEDLSSWVEVGQCAGLHFLSGQGHHGGAHLAFFPRHPHHTPSLHPLNRYGFNYYTPRLLGGDEPMYTKVYYVGVPYSRYTQVKPHTDGVFDTSRMTPQELSAHNKRFYPTHEIFLFNTTYYNYYRLILSAFTTRAEH